MRRFALVIACSALACRAADEPPQRSYFDRTIAPILQNSCSRQTTGCHIENPRGEAVGNLDTTTFARLSRRRDLLLRHGPYPYQGLLQKVIGPQSITVQGASEPVTITTDIRHAAGAGIDVSSDGFATLARWLDGGASESNVGAGTPAIAATGACRSNVPGKVEGPAPRAFDLFVEKVQPVLRDSCSAASCHGAALADLALTCGDDDAQRRWNESITAQYLADPIERSELLRRPLDPTAGGTWHSGGVIFGRTDDAGYRALLEWAKARGPATLGAGEENLRFFADRVQPLLVRKGCMFMGCHSPLSFHEYGLRGGAGGTFSLAATRKNYALSRSMLAVEAPHPHASRLVAKNLYPFDRDIDPGGLGILHRGGSLFEDVPGVERATPSACAGVDAVSGDLSSIPGYCVIVEWHRRERAKAIADGTIDGKPLSAIVYVARPADGDVPQDFEHHRPGAELHVVEAALGDDGTVTVGADVDRTAACGLDASTADIRRPAVSWDAKRVAFAARTAPGTPLSIYVLDLSTSTCAKHEVVSAHAISEHGILIHDFDPAWAPDGRLVFASTRGAIGQSDLSYAGPTRTPDGLRPNANLYVLEDGKIRQLTFLLGQEFAPDFKRNGQLIFSTEKRAPGFYQLAARRQNLDGSDYHPLYGQRKSVGFEQLLDVHHLPDGNIVGVFSDRGVPARGGTLGVANRSLGPDQFDRDPSDRFFMHSLSILDRGATGKLDSGPLYRSPALLPTTSVLASYAPSAGSTFALVQVDVRNGARFPLLSRADKSIVDSAAIYARPSNGVFTADPNEHQILPRLRDAEVRNVDLAMIASLMFDNRRVGRTVDPRVRALGILESLPPPQDLVSLAA
ncbi:MAG: TolB family protein, partial [Polyangiales bacterium]